MNCRVMGIVNVTPDSFSDGGRYFRPEEALRRARNLLDEGAEIVDLGGESTRPGATPVGWEEEWARIEPVLREMAGWQARVSVDTYHPETAARALELGAAMVNCVAREPIPAMVALVKAHAAAELVVPCRPGDDDAPYREIAERVYLDPMIGFGTTREEDLSLVRSVRELAKRGRVLVGVSRKRLVQKLTGEKVLGKNLGGSVGLALGCAAAGAAMVRVHDVRETVQALRAFGAVFAEEGR